VYSELHVLYYIIYNILLVLKSLAITIITAECDKMLLRDESKLLIEAKLGRADSSLT
jgi:hypothetical protein